MVFGAGSEWFFSIHSGRKKDSFGLVPVPVFGLVPAGHPNQGQTNPSDRFDRRESGQ